MKKEEKFIKLNPYWISGFVQADGCFNISINQSKKLKIQPRFSISQKEDQEILIRSIKEYFKVGFIIKSIKRKTIEFRINSLKDLNDIIIPHFDLYSLKYGKLESFLKFKLIIIKLLKKEHLKQDKLLEIIKISYDINKGKRKQIKNFLNDLNNNLLIKKWFPRSVKEIKYWIYKWFNTRWWMF